MASIHEVARAAGVSIATVSRTFGAPELLNQETRARVLEIADRLNYRPGRPGKAPVSGSSSRRAASSVAKDFIGFLFVASSDYDNIQTNAFYAPVLAGAQAEAEALGLHLLLNTTNRQALARELPRMVRKRTIGGMLMVGIGASDPAALEQFTPYVPSIVLVDNHDMTGKFDSVLSDGFRGAFAATQYLFGQGHRRIGFLLGDPEVATFGDRMDGYLSAHYKAGVPVNPSAILTLGPGEDLDSRLRAYLTAQHGLTALITANDFYALSVMRICRDLGLGIPDDLSVMGFDDLEFSAHMVPPLTTIRVDKEALGRLAVQRLFGRMREGGAPAPPVQMVVPVSLVVRQTVAPPA